MACYSAFVRSTTGKKQAILLVPVWLMFWHSAPGCSYSSGELLRALAALVSTARIVSMHDRRFYRKPRRFARKPSGMGTAGNGQSPPLRMTCPRACADIGRAPSAIVVIGDLDWVAPRSAIGADRCPAAI